MRFLNLFFLSFLLSSLYFLHYSFYQIDSFVIFSNATTTDSLCAKYDNCYYYQYCCNEHNNEYCFDQFPISLDICNDVNYLIFKLLFFYQDSFFHKIFVIVYYFIIYFIIYIIISVNLK